MTSPALPLAPLNHRHLHYFWVVAKEGGISRAAARLGVAVQTISSQLKELEQTLGTALFTQEGRRLVLTEAGRTTLHYADQIFLLGAQLQETLQAQGETHRLRLTVGISDALPKLIAYRLLEAALHLPQGLRLICQEGEFDELLADLALHKLDVVLTDRPAGSRPNLRVFSHPVGECRIGFYATPALADQLGPGFPASLEGAPLLLPTRDTALRSRIDAWLSARNLHPDVVGEFEDSALLMTFGRSGLGLFPAPSLLAANLAEQFGAQAVGEMEDVREQYYAISNERRIRHPAVEAIRLGAAALELG
ncbi:transcriptional activator NhaR [Azospira inquinata]|uniref:Transcriptional activator NhaR n=1 Tax=Azospira inquinata TaxID=2785627 RepID=A0A975SK65_9RHOO|nr:transcriptional activator NhaR [Azospira inquinata]QWT46848.1 transcriptional activator NhaR [Azospira inquinata]QWT47829.1 transcriptional activator NhaR [Azospira inquinata]